MILPLDIEIQNYFVLKKCNRTTNVHLLLLCTRIWHGTSNRHTYFTWRCLCLPPKLQSYTVWRIHKNLWLELVVSFAVWVHKQKEGNGYSNKTEKVIRNSIVPRPGAVHLKLFSPQYTAAKTAEQGSANLERAKLNGSSVLQSCNIQNTKRRMAPALQRHWSNVQSQALPQPLLIKPIPQLLIESTSRTDHGLLRACMLGPGKWWTINTCDCRLSCSHSLLPPHTPCIYWTLSAVLARCGSFLLLRFAFFLR